MCTVVEEVQTDGGGEKIKVVQRHAFLGGGFWFAAWLFTIGFMDLGFWRAVATLVIWRIT
jgi:hypothetical protein